jgi:flagellar basal-body rod modification protein FlgD
MDINSMMGTIQAQDARRVASGLTASRGNGVSTAATATTGAGSKLARSGTSTPMTSAAPAAGAKGAGTGSSTTNVTSNDFLTLLVSEMRNQDPTQPTDPNAYIQQLVQVNSLQQLISINSELSPSGTPTTGGARANPVAAGTVGGANLPLSATETMSSVASSVGIAPVQGWLPPLSGA